MSSYVPYIFVIVLLTITFIACWRKCDSQDIKYTNRIGNTGKILLPCPFCGREILLPCPICGEMRGEVECLDTDERRRFNGRLIAAAPEMYDWLKVFVKLFADNPNINMSCIQKLLESIEDDDFDKEIEVHE